MCKEKRCPYCLSLKITKKGWNKKGKKRRYKCKDCKKHFVEKGKSWFVSDKKIELIKRLLLERISLRGITRVVQVSLSWLLTYIKNLYSKVPKDLNYQPVLTEKEHKGKRYIKLIKSELDEMWSFVKKKENKQWIWIAQCRESRQIIAFYIGDRSTESATELWKKIPEVIKKYGLFYTDDWDPYKGVIPKKRHVYSTQKKETNHIERFIGTVRQRVSRLVRKSLSFSKLERNHEGAIGYFIADYNIQLHKLWNTT